jgi:hypothetical protein
MSVPYQMLGSAIVLDSALTLAYSLTAGDGSSSTTLDSSDAAHPTVAAGTYSPTDFLVAVGKALRSSVFARLVADPFVAVEPATAADIALFIGFDAVTPGVGATLVRLQITGLGGAESSAGPLVPESLTLVNTAQAWSPLGLAWAGETRTIAGTGERVVADGRFQPRSLLVVRSSFDDSGDSETLPRETRLLGDGSVYQWRPGLPSRRERRLTLVDHAASVVGPPWAVGVWGAFGGSGRHLLSLQARDESVLLGVSGLSLRQDALPAATYLRVGGYWARYRQTTGGALEAAEVWPSSAAPVAGETIEALPEALAWVLEVERTGLCWRYEPDDATGQTTYLGTPYALLARGELALAPRRRARSTLYSITLDLMRVPSPGSVAP